MCQCLLLKEKKRLTKWKRRKKSRRDKQKKKWVNQHLAGERSVLLFHFVLHCSIFLYSFLFFSFFFGSCGFPLSLGTCESRDGRRRRWRFIGSSKPPRKLEAGRPVLYGRHEGLPRGPHTWRGVWGPRAIATTVAFGGGGGGRGGPQALQSKAAAKSQHYAYYAVTHLSLSCFSECRQLLVG